MMRKTALWEVIMVIILLAGCAHTKPDGHNQITDGKTGQQSKSEGEGNPDENKSTLPHETINEANLRGITPTTPLPDANIHELPDGLQDIYFGFDSYTLDDSAKTVIKRLSALIEKNRTTQLLIEGHCDERGTTEYNLALGDKRANVVREYLSALGVASKRIEIISYGKEKPVCTEESEECWAKNRRAHFVIKKTEK